MPWVLREDLILSAFPAPAWIDKHGWVQPGRRLGMITLCSRAPVHTVIDRLQWYAHIPIPDGRIRPGRGMDDVIKARDTALSMLQHRHTVVIHCMAGRNRSGLIGALVLQELDNLTGPEALDRVRELRPRSVDNIYFEQFLMSLGRPRP